jgi:hypothetical protein
LRDLKGLGRKVRRIASMGEIRKSVKPIERHRNMKNLTSEDLCDICASILEIYKPTKLSRHMREYYANLMLERMNYVQNQDEKRE